VGKRKWDGSLVVKREGAVMPEAESAGMGRKTEGACNSIRGEVRFRFEEDKEERACLKGC